MLTVRRFALTSSLVVTHHGLLLKPSNISERTLIIIWLYPNRMVGIYVSSAANQLQEVAVVCVVFVWVIITIIVWKSSLCMKGHGIALSAYQKPKKRELEI